MLTSVITVIFGIANSVEVLTLNKYPDLSSAKQIGVDIETYDPNLEKLGPGVYRKDGKILGVSLSDGESFAAYYNLGHYDCSPDEQAHNLTYLRKVLALPVVKVGQHIIYDIDWLENGEHKIKVNGLLRCTEIAEALIDENQGEYNLEFMGRKYLNRGKKKTLPERFCEENGLKGKFQKWLWKMPYSQVREYAIEDANLPIVINKLQLALLENENMSELYDLECELIRCLLHFKKTGVRIDAEKRDRNALKVQNIIEAGLIELFEKFGKFNPNSSQQVAKILDKEGVAYPKHSTGNPKINMAFYKLNRDKHEFLRKIQFTKQGKHELTTYLDGALVRFLTADELIHCNFYNTRTDEYGTRSGRLSAAQPNLMQISSKDKFRDPIWGQLCREVFLPFANCYWLKIDWSQIEYRFIAHYARGEGAEELRAAYNNNPKIDYHAYVMELTELPRGQAKAMNFGIPYGMGIKGMCEQFGWSEEKATAIKEVYLAKAPYLKQSIADVTRIAERRGYIKTILNRRSRLIDKSKSYIMYCRLIQGSAADLMKKAMNDCYKAGIFHVLPPHLTLHDEIDVSMPKTKQGLEAAKEMANIMETSIKISVPIKVDPATGLNWADVKKVEWKDLEKELRYDRSFDTSMAN